MKKDNRSEPEISPQLIEAIKSFPLSREVEHCGGVISVSPFAIYAVCPQCMVKIKVRSFSAVTELEDVFDAVFNWMNQPRALQLAEERQEILKEDEE